MHDRNHRFRKSFGVDCYQCHNLLAQEGLWSRVEFRHIARGEFLRFVVFNIRGSYTVIVTKEKSENPAVLYTEFKLVSVVDRTEKWEY